MEMAGVFHWRGDGPGLRNHILAFADLEWCVDGNINPDIPMVFYAQSFCAKTALARHLADLHPRALYLDCDVNAGSSARSKIEAFLELSRAQSSKQRPPHAAG